MTRRTKTPRRWPWSKGPLERAAEQRLRDIAAADFIVDGRRLTLVEAEALSDAVWAAREQDGANRG